MFKLCKNYFDFFVVVVVEVVVVRVVFDLIVVVINFQISLFTKKFEPKTDFILKQNGSKKMLIQ